ncbi:CvpA family protein [Desulfitobacterium sp. THU1]|uniref:CvpA family protein n=1 Tax=Desulfitobacterium sp. THU1 TaxID=3138072 RepID=UPI00311F5C94
MNSFDIFILAIVLIGAIQGYRKGLISGIISLGGSLAGLVLAAQNYQILVQWLDQRLPLRVWLEAAIYKRILPTIESKAAVIEEQTVEKFLSIFPEELRSALGGSNLPDVELYTDSALQSITHNFAQALSDNAMKIIAFALVYFGVIIIIEIISALLLAPLGFLSGTINGGGGLLTGGLVTFLGLAVFFGLFSPLFTIANSGETIGFIEGSTLHPYLLQTYSFLGDFLRLNIEQGFRLPIDLEDLTLPSPNIPDLNLKDPNAINL